MATQNHNTQTTADRLREAETQCDKAYEENTELWAIAQLGEMLNTLHEQVGYEALETQQLAAIGIAINRLADQACTRQGAEAERLSKIVGELRDQHEKEQNRQRRLHSEMDERELSQVCHFLERLNAGELTMENIENVREICPELEQETAEKFLAILTDGKASDSPGLSVVS